MESDGITGSDSTVNHCISEARFLNSEELSQMKSSPLPPQLPGPELIRLYGPMNSSKISPRDTQMRHASQHNHAHQNPTLYGPPLFTPSAVAANSTNVTQQQKPL